jgi:CO dehydrogenase maturation factor
MAKSLVELGYRVIVIDMDESNPFISRRLQVSNPVPLIKINEFDDDISRQWMLEDLILFDDIPEDFISKTPDGEIGVMCAGKIENALQGCACSMSSMVGEFLRKISISNREIILIDNEAGVESFGRGIENDVDAVLDVVIPTMDSASLSERISKMCKELGIRRVWSIINKVPSPDLRKLIIDEMNRRDIKYLGLLEEDNALMAETFGVGKSENKGFKEKVNQLTRIMLDECEMTYCLEASYN